jgi:hypothetical protein
MLTRRAAAPSFLAIDGEIAERYVPLRPSSRRAGSQLSLDCSASAPGAGTAISPGASLELRAIDLAGNESSDNGAFNLASSCEAAERAAAGCAFSRRPTGMPLLLGALLPLTCLLRRRGFSSSRPRSRAIAAGVACSKSEAAGTRHKLEPE